MSTIASHSPLNILETVRDRGLVAKDHQQENGVWGIKWSRDFQRVRVTDDYVSWSKSVSLQWTAVQQEGSVMS